MSQCQSSHSQLLCGPHISPRSLRYCLQRVSASTSIVLRSSVRGRLVASDLATTTFHRARNSLPVRLPPPLTRSPLTKHKRLNQAVLGCAWSLHTLLFCTRIASIVFVLAPEIGSSGIMLNTSLVCCARKALLCSHTQLKDIQRRAAVSTTCSGQLQFAVLVSTLCASVCVAQLPDIPNVGYRSTVHVIVNTPNCPKRPRCACSWPFPPSGHLHSTLSHSCCHWVRSE